jgi:hypothetical protein
MKTSSAKQKGRKLQQLVRDRLLSAFPQLEQGDVRSVAMGSQGEDIQLSPAARKIMPIAVETKARRGIAVGRWYEQAEEHAIAVKASVEPVVVMKEDRKDPLVLISLNFFVDLLVDRYDHYKDWLAQEQEISKSARKEKQ